MTTELIKSLEKLGLSDKEAKIYVAGLGLSKFSVMAISEKTGIKRPTCYLILEELKTKGLITTFPKAKKVLYVTEHPNHLLKSSEDNFRLAKQLMPELQNLIGSTSEKPILKVYAGQSGIHNIFEDILDEGKDFYYIASVVDLVNELGQEYQDEWIKRRVTKKMQSISIRITEGEMDYELYKDTPETPRTIRYAPKGFQMPYTIFIYGKKVAFISRKKQYFGFIVESKDMAISMKALFDVVWSVSSEKVS
ncbi:MAG: helix-turn-helix domain-containing protein [Candidatus Paceibacterota bacterium]|jgi:sugar-specific transcriptional regulator TrmB